MTEGRETFLHILDGEMLDVDVSYCVSGDGHSAEGPTIRWSARTSANANPLDLTLSGMLTMDRGFVQDPGAAAAIAARRALAQRLDDVRQMLKDMH